MSNLVFPQSLAGYLSTSEAPYQKTIIQETITGKEFRTSYWATPRTKYAIDLRLLRNSVGYTEFAQLCAFFTRHAGQLDSFLIQDPEDCVVTDHGFAVGDGSTAAFQLQRTLSGLKGTGLGTPNNGTKPRTNMVLWSQDVSNAAWAKSISGTGVIAAASAAVGIAPDGTATASLVTLNKGAGSTSSDAALIATSAAATTVGSTYTFSIWLRTSDGTSKLVGLDSSGTHANTNTITVTGAWQRFSITDTAVSTGDKGRVLLFGPLATASSAFLYTWGAQFEPGSSATTYIPTTTVSLTSNPSYWPSIADSFEPIYDVRQAASTEVSTDTSYDGTPSVWQDGDWPLRRRLYQNARTNLVTFSEQIDNAAWTKTAVTVSANADVAPDGTTTADRIAEDNTNNNHLVSPAFSTATVGRLYCFSVYMRAGTRTTVWVGHNNPSLYSVSVDLSAGTVTGVGSNIVASGIQALPGGWYRVYGSWVAAAASGWYFGANTFNTYAGTTGLYVSAWGAQIEIDRSTPTGYIKTPSSSTVTVTDYTVSSTALVTLATAPPLGSYLSWTGGYYERVRFDAEQLALDRLIASWWSASSVGLVSVLP